MSILFNLKLYISKTFMGLLIATSILLGLYAPVQAATIYVHYDVGWGNWITIRGDGSALNWYDGEDATWTNDNVWVWSSPPGTGAFEFKPLINDNTWSTGANYYVPNDNSEVHIYPFFGPAQGTLVTIPNFYSSQLNNYRHLILYLPPSYNENTLKHYPVLYMHDGQNLFEANTAFGGVEWEVDETLNSMIGLGDVQEVIVVGLYSTANRLSEYTPTVDPDYGGGNADAYLDFIENSVKPYIDSNYRTLAGTEDTLIMGSSLGGLVSCYGAWTRPDVFGSAGCMSSSFWWDEENFVAEVDNYQSSKKDITIYLDVGGYESSAMQSATNRMTGALEDLNYVHGDDLFHWYDSYGGHNETSWANRLDIPFERLLPFE